MTPKQIEKKWIEILHKVLGDELKEFKTGQIKFIAGTMMAMIQEDKKGKLETRIKRTWKKVKGMVGDNP